MARQRLSRGTPGREPAAAPRGVRGQRASAEAQNQLALRDPAGEAGRSGAESRHWLLEGGGGPSLQGLQGGGGGGAEGGLRVEKGARPDGGEDKEGQNNGPRRTAVGGPGKTELKNKGNREGVGKLAHQFLISSVTKRHHFPRL